MGTVEVCRRDWGRRAVNRGSTGALRPEGKGRRDVLEGEVYKVGLGVRCKGPLVGGERAGFGEVR